MGEFPEFGKIDLGRLTMAGWLLMIVTIASIFVVALAERRLLLLFGYDLPQGSGRSGLAIFVVVVAVGVAAGIFQSGKGLGTSPDCRSSGRYESGEKSISPDGPAVSIARPSLLRRCCDRFVGADRNAKNHRNAPDAALAPWRPRHPAVWMSSDRRPRLIPTGLCTAFGPADGVLGEGTPTPPPGREPTSGPWQTRSP